MSEEQNIQENAQEVVTEEKVKKGSSLCCKLMTVGVILSLLMSIGALTTSIIALNGGGGAKKEVVISKQYDKGQSIEKAIATKKPMIVFFYTDWCGFCQRFIPTFAKVAKDKKIKENFAVAYVNCENPANQKHMQEYEVKGFPTVFVVDADGKRTHLENKTFFNDDSVDVIKENALKAIGQ